MRRGCGEEDGEDEDGLAMGSSAWPVARLLFLFLPFFLHLHPRRRHRHLCLRSSFLKYSRDPYPCVARHGIHRRLSRHKDRQEQRMCVCELSVFFTLHGASNRYQPPSCLAHWLHAKSNFGPTSEIANNSSSSVFRSSSCLPLFFSRLCCLVRKRNSEEGIRDCSS